MSDAPATPTASPVIVAVCAWLVPGWGYVVLGHRLRGLVVGVNIVALFVLGILIGGIRIMDPPGWGMYGYMVQITQSVSRGEVYINRKEPMSQREEERNASGSAPAQTALFNQPLSEIGEKPWYVGQILCGPITLLSSAISVHEAKRVVELPDGSEDWLVPVSHSRSWEIGALYTAVAGMLNLLAIIDATFRAAQPNNASGAPDGQSASGKSVAEAA